MGKLGQGLLADGPDKDLELLGGMCVASVTSGVTPPYRRPRGPDWDSDCSCLLSTTCQALADSHTARMTSFYH